MRAFPGVRMIDSPFFEDLRHAVEVAYAAAPGQVSAALEVCTCPVCMTENTRAEIVATPCRGLSPGLVGEYTNSAHGVPSNLDDLAALLPRYMDLMADGVGTDALGIGVELSRFGEAAARLDGAFPDPALRAAFHDWARLLLLHGGWARARTGRGRVYEDRLSAFYLFQALAAGGVPAQVVTGALDALFAESGPGRVARAQFFAELGAAWDGRSFDLYALRYVGEEGRAALADWLQRRLASPDLEELLTDPDFRGPDFWAETAQVALVNRAALTPRALAEKDG